MTPVDLAAYVRLKTRTNADTLTDANILIFLNARIDFIAQRILDADEDIFLVPQTANLKENIREYSFPKKILSRIKRVEAKLDETNFIVLGEFDLPDYRKPTDETNITNEFANLEGECFFKIMRKSIVIYSGSITDVTDGLKIWCMTWPAHIATDMTGTTDMSEDPTTTTHGMPRAVHQLLADGVVIDWKESREKPIPLSEREMAYEIRVREAIDTLRHGNLDREVIGRLPDASKVWDDGYNL